jgi:CRP-like cAMP-binding protein
MLKEVPLFAGLNQRQLRQVAKVIYEYPVPLKPGKELVREGDPGREFFVILEGQAKVARGGRTLRKLSRGDYFGEVSLLDGQRRTASVVAETELRLMGLNRKSFQALLDSVPGLSQKLLEALCHYVREAEKAHKVALF